jgi:pimeloyl-ACP methyl ester carboxylesterase
VRTSDYLGLEPAAADLAHFDRPALVLWASEDRVMPPDHGRRLAQIIPGAHHVEVDDAYTLLPLDRPDQVAEHLASFAQSLRRTSQI